MKTYVINLKRSVERRDHITAECRRHGLDFEIVDAIDGMLMSDEDFAPLIDKESVAKNPTYLNRGMLACSLSHLKVYEKFVDDGGPVALIVEDDAEFDEGFVDLIESTTRLLKGSEVALLYFVSRDALGLSKSNASDLGRGRRLMYPLTLDYVGSTAAYLVTRAAAANLSKGLLPLRTAPDNWNEFVRRRLIDNVRMVYPPIASVIYAKSTINIIGQNRIRVALTSLLEKYDVPIFSTYLRNRRRQNVLSMTEFYLTDAVSEFDR
jgi:glycosyl transferase family 25